MAEKTELSKDEAKEKLLQGETISNHYIDRINLNKRDLEGPIEIEDCVIDTLDFNKSVFKGEVSIRRCKIKTLVLSDAVFEQKVNFKKSIIGRGRIQSAIFHKNFNAESVKWSYTSFHKTVFKEKVDFSRGSFTGDATFTNAQFEAEGNFSFVTFEGNGVFEFTGWKGTADFRNVQVQEDLKFYRASFDEKLDFNGAVVRLSINMTQAKLDAMTDFANAMVGRTIELGGVTLSEEQGFRFSSVTTSSIIMDRDTVEGHVFPESEGKYDLAAKEYGFLRTNFQSINRFEDEDWAYYQFKRMERKSLKGSSPFALLRKFFSYSFLDLGCGYGTKPFRTLSVGAVVIFAFALLYYVHLLGIPLTANYGFSGDFANRFFHSINISLIAFSGGYGDLTIVGPIKIAAMVEYMLGVVFMGLFVVAFSRKVIR